MDTELPEISPPLMIKVPETNTPPPKEEGPLLCVLAVIRTPVPTSSVPPVSTITRALLLLVIPLR
jgi:hypothetical protein